VNVPADIIDNYAEELLAVLEGERTSLDDARILLIANGLKNMAQDLRGDDTPLSVRRRRTWWIGN
jgi:hypothetical protein